jgi:hypothetical protein
MMAATRTVAARMERNYGVPVSREITDCIFLPRTQAGRGFGMGLNRKSREV